MAADCWLDFFVHSQRFVRGAAPVELSDNVLAACGTWIGALEAPIAFLGSCGLSTHAANAVKAASIARGREIELAAKAAGATIILKGDTGYPTRLLDLESPPRALFCRGNLKLLNQAGVAVVGSREHTGYGVAACRIADKHGQQDLVRFYLRAATRPSASAPPGDPGQNTREAFGSVLGTTEQAFTREWLSYLHRLSRG